MFWRQWSTNSSNPEACSEANCRFKAVFLIYFELTWLPWSIRTRSKFWCGWRRFWWHVLRVAAQPLLLFAQRDHFAAKLLVWRPAYKSTIHILGFDVGLDLVPVSEPEKHFIYEWSENESWPSVSHKYNLLRKQNRLQKQFFGLKLQACSLVTRYLGSPGCGFLAPSSSRRAS